MRLLALVSACALMFAPAARAEEAADVSAYFYGVVCVSSAPGEQVGEVFARAGEAAAIDEVSRVMGADVCAFTPYPMPGRMLGAVRTWAHNGVNVTLHRIEVYDSGITAEFYMLVYEPTI